VHGLGCHGDSPLRQVLADHRLQLAQVCVQGATATTTPHSATLGEPSPSRSKALQTSPRKRRGAVSSSGAHPPALKPRMPSASFSVAIASSRQPGQGGTETCGSRLARTATEGSTPGHTCTRVHERRHMGGHAHRRKRSSQRPRHRHTERDRGRYPPLKANRKAFWSKETFSPPMAALSDATSTGVTGVLPEQAHRRTQARKHRVVCGQGARHQDGCVANVREGSQLVQQGGGDGQAVTPSQAQNLIHVAEGGPHDDGLVADSDVCNSKRTAAKGDRACITTLVLVCGSHSDGHTPRRTHASCSSGRCG
jgi:hypothetical protein